MFSLFKKDKIESIKKLYTSMSIIGVDLDTKDERYEVICHVAFDTAIEKMTKDFSDFGLKADYANKKQLDNQIIIKAARTEEDFNRNTFLSLKANGVSDEDMQQTYACTLNLNLPESLRNIHISGTVNVGVAICFEH